MTTDTPPQPSSDTLTVLMALADELEAAAVRYGHERAGLDEHQECVDAKQALRTALTRALSEAGAEQRPAATFSMNAADLERIRQWYDSMIDTTPAYAEKADHELAVRVYQSLGMRVPHSLRDAAAPLAGSSPQQAPIATVMGLRVYESAAGSPMGEAKTDGTVAVTREDANNYCRILTLLGMEEEGDPVAKVQQLLEPRAAIQPSGKQAGEARAVAWTRTLTIEDHTGRPIGMDEPEVRWGAECPDPDEDWSPLYAAPQPLSLTDAARDVLGERERQVSVEGWTLEHDDFHQEGELSLAAGGYAIAASDQLQAIFNEFDAAGEPTLNDPVCQCDRAWPHGWAFKPCPPRRALIKAGALILAEIERLDRAAAGVKKG